MEFRVCAPAKVNLRLKVISRRADGYHNLSMLNVAVSLFDDLTVTAKKGRGVDLSVVREGGEAVPELCDPQRNLATRALADLLARLGLSFSLQVRLLKRVPWGAGLGGGSSDGAAALRVARELAIRSGIAAVDVDHELRACAGSLGADVPFLVAPAPSVVGGIGESIRPIAAGAFKGTELILIFPPVELPTKDVFQAMVPRTLAEPLTVESLGSYDPPLARWEADLVKEGACFTLGEILDNDLQEAACRVSSLIWECLGRIRGLQGVQGLMSGSGSTLFVVNECGGGLPAGTGDRVLDALKGLECRIVEVRVLDPLGNCCTVVAA